MTALDDFRTTRRHTLELVAGLPQSRIDHRPAPGKWSLGQVLDHLLRIDDLFRDELAELVARGKAGEGGLLYRGFDHFGVEVPFVPKAAYPLFEVPLAAAGLFLPTRLRSILTRPRWMPTKAPPLIKPKSGRPADQLRGELQGTLDFVERIHAENPDLRFADLRYYNPLLGFTNLPGILAFSASHEKRHQEQMQDIIAGLPGSA